MEGKLFRLVDIPGDQTNVPYAVAAILKEECFACEKRIRESGGFYFQRLGYDYCSNQHHHGKLDDSSARFGGKEGSSNKTAVEGKIFKDFPVLVLKEHPIVIVITNEARAWRK